MRHTCRRLGAAVVFAPEDVVSSDQTHTTNVRLVGAEDRGNGITRPRTFHDTDGMITNVPGVVLATYYADCVPLYSAPILQNFLPPSARPSARTAMK